jgi:hypothetical protein
MSQPESIADFKARIAAMMREAGAPWQPATERPPIVAPRGAHWAQLDRMEREKAQRLAKKEA